MAEHCELRLLTLLASLDDIAVAENHSVLADLMTIPDDAETWLRSILRRGDEQWEAMRKEVSESRQVLRGSE